jgi:hypothetical protein
MDYYYSRLLSSDVNLVQPYSRDQVGVKVDPVILSGWVKMRLSAREMHLFRCEWKKRGRKRHPISKIGKVFWSAELPPDFSLACGLNLVFSARTSKVY